MTGSGFAANETCIIILFAEMVVGTDIIANGTGDWEASFMVPEMPAGMYSVTAEGEWTPKEDITALSFEIEPSSVRCFIVTAAYGTPIAEGITILRDFRDECLLTNLLGQAFVNLYYRVSPPIAALITEHPSLKSTVRVGLLPAAVISTVAVNTGPGEKMAIIGLLVLVSVAVVVWATRRRGSTDGFDST
ncbi:MAG: hypothetical protein KAV87_13330 [Desulfobacteraceae bacterium]|nr:hypothetical protein [Desulfobacteraceae bacterium]